MVIKGRKRCTLYVSSNKTNLTWHNISCLGARIVTCVQPRQTLVGNDCFLLLLTWLIKMALETLQCLVYEIFCFVCHVREPSF